MRIIISILAFLLFVVGCQTNNTTQVDETTNSNAPTNNVGDNSYNAIDWPGKYTGVLPCADCEGIQTLVLLNQNGTYSMKSTYLGKSKLDYKSEGRFKWDEDGRTITLYLTNSTAANPQYLVGENKLILLDKAGNLVEGDLADKYVLQKQ